MSVNGEYDVKLKKREKENNNLFKTWQNISKQKQDGNSMCFVICLLRQNKIFFVIPLELP